MKGVTWGGGINDDGGGGVLLLCVLCVSLRCLLDQQQRSFNDHIFAEHDNRCGAGCILAHRSLRSTLYPSPPSPPTTQIFEPRVETYVSRNLSMTEKGTAIPVSLNSPNRNVRLSARYSLAKVHHDRVKALTGTMLSTSRVSSWRARKFGVKDESPRQGGARDKTRRGQKEKMASRRGHEPVQVRGSPNGVEGFRCSLSCFLAGS